MQDWLSLTLFILAVLSYLAWRLGLFDYLTPRTGAIVLAFLGLLAIVATLLPAPVRQITGTMPGLASYENGEYSITIRSQHDSYSVFGADYNSTTFTFSSADRFPALDEAGNTDVFHVRYVPGSFHDPDQLHEITELSGPYPEFHFRPAVSTTADHRFFIRIILEIVGLVYLFFAYRKWRQHIGLKRLDISEARENDLMNKM